MRRSCHGKDDWVDRKCRRGEITHNMQQDTFSCGVFVMQMAKEVAQNFPNIHSQIDKEPSQKHMEQLRKEMAEDILKMSGRWWLVHSRSLRCGRFLHPFWTPRGPRRMLFEPSWTQGVFSTSWSGRGTVRRRHSGWRTSWTLRCCGSHRPSSHRRSTFHFPFVLSLSYTPGFSSPITCSLFNPLFPHVCQFE
ncbi:uncharacterized protein wu:fc27b11 isoform X1 [Oncorhynchus mykiss]|uniref:uncharacterized protein wu:fc27b11 isoform X1 n=1 Tax=Oncorhynchus mykiss TaxID=8022 RepID=UPI0018779AA0|nr:uncharacterized protein wu:fc27b11 isoform X1 [Oncorhynchus mykiss]